MRRDGRCACRTSPASNPAQDYGANAYLSGQPTVIAAVFQRPGSNALGAAQAVSAKMESMSKRFPKGLEYRGIYNSTEFIAQSIDAVKHTLVEAMILVVLVILVFLQKWRAAIIPIVAIPVSLIGTFAVLASFGYWLNNLSLFGLVLAIGIVVDADVTAPPADFARRVDRLDRAQRWRHLHRRADPLVAGAIA